MTMNTNDQTLDRIEHLSRRVSNELEHRYIKEQNWCSRTMFFMEQLHNALHDCFTDMAQVFEVFVSDQFAVIMHIIMVSATTKEEAVKIVRELRTRDDLGKEQPFVCNNWSVSAVPLEFVRNVNIVK